MADVTEHHDHGPDGVFAMDPDPTLREIARRIVLGQANIAGLLRHAATLRANAPDDPDVSTFLADLDGTVESWHGEALPSLVASLKLALEVHDTFGGQAVTIDDPLDAALWNNKYFAWTRELSGRPLD